MKNNLLNYIFCDENHKQYQFDFDLNLSQEYG